MFLVYVHEQTHNLEDLFRISLPGKAILNQAYIIYYNHSLDLSMRKLTECIGTYRGKSVQH